MTKCSKCKRNIQDIYFNCKYCHQNYCSKHRIPEDHNCEGLKQYKEKNQERWVNAITENNKQNFYSENKKEVAYKISIKSKLRKYNYLFWRFIKKYLLVIILILLILGVFAYSRGMFSDFIKKCEDGTWYNFCSKDKPLYCLQGELVKNVSRCGCPDDFIIEGEGCKSKYETNPKQINLGYFNYEVYGGLDDYLSNKSRAIWYYEGEQEPTNKDFIIRDLDEPIQKRYLLGLVKKIEEQSSDKKEQARVAISIVQGIPYDWEAFNTGNVEGRYPYEVLYDMKGVCMEKSDLLAFLLRNLGFGLAIFEFDLESHRAVGIKCDNGNYGSNYCFIEATDYYPIGQIPYEYVGGVDIKDAIPEIIIISDGESY